MIRPGRAGNNDGDWGPTGTPQPSVVVLSSCDSYRPSLCQIWILGSLTLVAAGASESSNYAQAPKGLFVQKNLREAFLSLMFSRLSRISVDIIANGSSLPESG